MNHPVHPRNAEPPACRTAVLSACLLAGLAGWWVMSLCEEGATPLTAQKPPVPASLADSGFSVKDTLQKLRQARPGSAEISRIAALLSSVPDNSLEDLQSELYTLPPSTLQQFALTLLMQRHAPAADPSAAPEADDVPPPNDFRNLEEDLAAGGIPTNATSISPGFNSGVLRDLVSADPSMAAAAVLKMPPGRNRENAVAITADVMALTDPAAALEFALRSGERRSACGPAWAKLITAPATPGSPSPLAGEFLQRMTPQQQDSLFFQLTDLSGSFDDSNRSPNTPSGGSDLAAIAREVLGAAEPGSGFRAFFEDLAEHHPRVAEELENFINSPIPSSAGPNAPFEILFGPVQIAALEIFTAHRVQRQVEAGDDPAFVLAALSWDTPLLSDPVWNRAAPSVIPGLARAGRLPEAIQMLDTITDPAARTSALQGLLPAWMDADPAAARAAFQSLPLTALERERWEQHPSFRLHPAP